MKLLITGGAGFIGSAVTWHIVNNTADEVVNLDKLTYVGLCQQQLAALVISVQQSANQ